MAKDIPSKGMLEYFTEPFEREGSFGRNAIASAINVKEVGLDDFGKSLSGEEKLSFRDLMGLVDKKYDVNPYFQADEGEELGKLKTFGNFTIDVLGDIFTSPSTYATGGVSALSKLGSVSKLASTTNKATSAIPKIGTALKIGNNDITRGAVGGVMGALNIDPDDDAGDRLKKITSGAAIGMGLNPVLKGVGSAIGKGLSGAVDILGEGAAPVTMAAIRKLGNKLKVSEASNIANSPELKERTAKKARMFSDEIGGVFDTLYDDVFKATNSEDKAEGAVTAFKEMLGVGFGKVVNLRNTAHNVLKTKHQISNLGAQKSSKKLNALFQKQSDNLFDALREEVGAEEAGHLMKTFIERGGVGAGVDTLGESTKLANNVFNIYDDLPRMSGAQKIVNKQILENKIPEELRGEFLHTLDNYDRAQAKLVKDYNLFAKENGMGGFEKINFHTVDLKDLDNILKDSEKQMFGRVTAGAKKRESSKVLTKLEGMTEKEQMQLGARRHAALFITEKEKQAKQIVNAMQDARSFENNGYNKFLNSYDDLLTLTKSVWLNVGASWMTNTLHENILKSFVAGGPSATLNAMGSGTGKAIYKLSMAEEVAKLKIFQESNMLQKISRTMRGQKGGYSLSSKDPWLDAASDLGVIDNGFYQEIKSSLNEGEDILNGVISKSNSKTIAASMKNVRESKMIDAADFLFKYSPFGRAAQGFETGARLSTFKALFETELKAAGLGAKEIDLVMRKGPTAISSAGKTSKRLNISAARTAMEKAASKTKDAFYDYSSVNAAERYIGKRFIPFYNFVSKDLEFWSRAAFDKPRSGVIESVLSAEGRSLTDEERLMTPSYLLSQGARVRDGKVVTTPSLPMVSSASRVDKMLLDSDSSISSDFAPIPKAAVEFLTNKDSFGRQISPTDDKPITRMQETSIVNLIDRLGGLDSLLSAKRDQGTGRIYTTGKFIPRLLKAAETVFPTDTPLLKQIMVRPKVDEYRGIDYLESVMNGLNPMKEAYLTPEQLKRTREIRIRNENKIRSGIITPSEIDALRRFKKKIRN